MLVRFQLSLPKFKYALVAELVDSINKKNQESTTMANRKISLSRQKIEEALKEFPFSMYKASQFLGVSYTSFVRYAKSEGLYNPNPGGKGVSKPWANKIDLSEMLVKGKHRNTSALKLRLFKEHLKEEICEECGQLPEWNGKKLVMHLDHVDGDPTNNQIENLRILCPNCHTQTDTYCRGRGKTKINTLVVER